MSDLLDLEIKPIQEFTPEITKGDTMLGYGPNILEERHNSSLYTVNAEFSELVSTLIRARGNIYNPKPCNVNHENSGILLALGENKLISAELTNVKVFEDYTEYTLYCYGTHNVIDTNTFPYDTTLNRDVIYKNVIQIPTVVREVEADEFGNDYYSIRNMRYDKNNPSSEYDTYWRVEDGPNKYEEINRFTKVTSELVYMKLSDSGEDGLRPLEEELPDSLKFIEKSLVPSEDKRYEILSVDARMNEVEKFFEDKLDTDFEKLNLSNMKQVFAQDPKNPTNAFLTDLVDKLDWSTKRFTNNHAVFHKDLILPVTHDDLAKVVKDSLKLSTYIEAEGFSPNTTFNPTLPEIIKTNLYRIGQDKLGKLEKQHDAKQISDIELLQSAELLENIVKFCANSVDDLKSSYTPNKRINELLEEYKQRQK